MPGRRTLFGRYMTRMKEYRTVNANDAAITAIPYFENTGNYAVDNRVIFQVETSANITAYTFNLYVNCLYDGDVGNCTPSTGSTFCLFESKVINGGSAIVSFKDVPPGMAKVSITAITASDTNAKSIEINYSITE